VFFKQIAAINYRKVANSGRDFNQSIVFDNGDCSSFQRMNRHTERSGCRLAKILVENGVGEHSLLYGRTVVSAAWV
jgi:hypothetical protein